MLPLSIEEEDKIKDIGASRKHPFLNVLVLIR
jgi:hypothetical protein